MVKKNKKKIDDFIKKKKELHLDPDTIADLTFRSIRKRQVMPKYNIPLESKEEQEKLSKDNEESSKEEE